MASKVEDRVNLIETILPGEGAMQVQTEGKKKKKRMFLNGVFIQGEVRNQNGRIYPRDEIQRAVDSLNNRIAQGFNILGEADHPEGMVVGVQNASHEITEMRMQGDNGIGKLRILKTPAGEVCRSLLEEGIKLGVSSRGNGYMQPDGRVVDYEILTVDIVANPSAPGAYPNLLLERIMNFGTGGEFLELAGNRARGVNTKQCDMHFERHLKSFIGELGRA